MKGRKPLPTVVKLISRSQHLRDDIDDEPIPPGVLIEPPTSITESQKKLWDDAIENAPRGLLRKLDGRLLYVWVVAADLHEMATREVNRFGMIVKSPKQGLPIQSPYLPIMNRQAEIMARYTAELGFSPTSRSRITLAGSGAKSTNRFSNNSARNRA